MKPRNPGGLWEKWTGNPIGRDPVKCSRCEAMRLPEQLSDHHKSKHPTSFKQLCRVLTGLDGKLESLQRVTGPVEEVEGSVDLKATAVPRQSVKFAVDSLSA